MDRHAIEAVVFDLLRQVSRHPIAPTRNSAITRDLGFDSIAVLELVCAIEERFDITVPLNAIEHIRTVRAIVDHVHDNLETAARP